MRRPDAFADPRLWLLLAALTLALGALAHPRIGIQRRQLDLLFVVDITGSMNVRDYARDGRPLSRLDLVKRQLVRLLADLPCGSRAGLAVFSERRPFLLLAPVETCGNYAPLAGTIEALDWRMAWEGDSRIANGLFESVALAGSLGADLVFLSDGQETPPLPAGGGPAFDGKPGAVRGLVVGVGGDAPAPIPKFDEDGRETGFLGEGDVEQESRFGLPPAGAEQREGYNARNAPFGSAAAHGTEHLSSLREAYLRSLAQTTGLAYARLRERADWTDALARAATPRHAAASLDLRFVCALAAIVALLGACVVSLPIARRRPSNRSVPPDLPGENDENVPAGPHRRRGLPAAAGGRRARPDAAQAR